MPASPSSGSSFWRNQLRQWHWISSAICLAGLLLFAVTGFTLNHAAEMEAKPRTERIERELSEDVLKVFADARDQTALPTPAVAAIKTASGIDVRGIKAEITDGEIYLDMQQPGVSASMTIDTLGGTLSYERTDRGVIAVLNDLHKGRHAGPVWAFFIDLIAVACAVFALTGLGLLWVYERSRRITWPLVGAGILLPFIIFMLFVHP